jgi:flagellin
MAMVVNTNVSSLIAQSAANATNKTLDTAMERLSTGKRINSAADDAAGVAIASRLESEIRGVNQAIRNASDAQAMIDTAEGAHIEISNILQRLREISVQSANDSNNATDRSYLQKEVTALVAEIDRIANVSTWAGKSLISANTDFDFQLGSHGGGQNEVRVSTVAMTGAALGIKAGTASVGTNGATLTQVGGSGMQIGGTAVKGDVYKFTLNGDTFEAEVTADDGTNFDFAYKINGVTVTTASTANTVDLTDDIADSALGNDNHAVAKAIALLINANADTGDGGTQGGMVATAASDGSVLLDQNVILASGSLYDDHSTTDGSADVTGVLDTSANTITFAGAKLLVADQDGISFTLGGQAFAIELTTAGAYNENADGALKMVNDELAAHQSAVKGLTNLSAAYSNNDLVISFTPATALSSVSATAGQSTSALLIDTQNNAQAAIATIDTALGKVNSQRAELGAVSNRMDSTISNMTNMSVNLEGGKSRIEDADFAAETAQLTKSQILQQAATSMLAQANASKQSVLSLLQG